MEQNQTVSNQETNASVVDTLCRDVVKKLNQTIFEQAAQIKSLQDSVTELNFKKEEEHSPNQNLLFEALTKAKADLKVENLEKTGSGNRGSYATYIDLVYHARPFLTAYGLDIIHEPVEKNDKDFLKTTISHHSGQWRSSTCALRIDYKGPIANLHQAYGSALTYMKKYVYASILNLHTGD
jgi:hypothetical protein